MSGYNRPSCVLSVVFDVTEASLSFITVQQLLSKQIWVHILKNGRTYIPRRDTGFCSLQERTWKDLGKSRGTVKV
jgi:hypothetical protein